MSKKFTKTSNSADSPSSVKETKAVQIDIEQQQKSLPWQKIFWCSLVLMLGILWVSGYDSGFGSDEMDMNIYGKANIAYYQSGFKDTSFLHPDHKDGVVLPATLPYYGSGFEYFASGLTALLNDSYEYNTRHLLNQFFAVLGLLFTGLVAAHLSNYKAAVLAIWMMFMTPIFSGLAIFDTKDIPFLTAYIASIYYLIIFFEEGPRPNRKTLLALGFWLWLLLSIRIGGLLLFGFIGVYALLNSRAENLKGANIIQWGSRLALVCALAFGLMILTWPFVLMDPTNNLIKCINVIKDFPQKILVAFEGDYIDSLHLPKHYLSKMMMLTIPLIVLISILLGFVGIVVSGLKQTKSKVFLLLILSGLFPIVYAVYSEMPLYNSWRHLLFVYPPIIAASSAGVILLLERHLQNSSLQWSLVGVFCLGLLSPASWWVKYNPYQYTYYNELAGGYDRVYYEYDTDYWQITVKEAIDWLMKNEPIKQSKDTLIITTNAYTMSNYYVKKRYPEVKVKFEMLGEKSRYGAKGIYSIFNNLFLEPQYLENCFPSPFAIHTVDIGGKATTYVAKDTAQYCYHGYKAFNNNDKNEADSFFNLYLEQIKYDGSYKNLSPFFGVIAFNWLNLDKFDEALALNQKVLQLYPSDFMANLTMGGLNIARQNFPDALRYLKAAEQIKPNQEATRAYLQLLQQLQQGNQPK